MYRMHRTHGRIEFTDSMTEVVSKLSDGNPGAINVCCMTLRDAALFDPDHILKGFGYLLSLDTLGIYGSRIWMLYSDVCRKDFVRFLAVIRAFGFGLISRNEVVGWVQDAAEIPSAERLEVIQRAVKERLPQFGA